MALLVLMCSVEHLSGLNHCLGLIIALAGNCQAERSRSLT